MKALTLTQPWATLVAIGVKSVETRGWRPLSGNYVNCPMLIHAAGDFPRGARLVCGREPFRGVLAQFGYRDPSQLPLGELLAVVEVIKYERTEVAAPAISKMELAFGDYHPGRWAWYLNRLARLAEPLAIRGARGLWETDEPDSTTGESRSNVTTLIYRQCDVDGVRWWQRQHA